MQGCGSSSAQVKTNKIHADDTRDTFVPISRPTSALESQSASMPSLSNSQASTRAPTPNTIPITLVDSSQPLQAAESPKPKPHVLAPIKELTESGKQRLRDKELNRPLKFTIDVPKTESATGPSADLLARLSKPIARKKVDPVPDASLPENMPTNAASERSRALSISKYVSVASLYEQYLLPPRDGACLVVVIIVCIHLVSLI